MTTHKDHDEVGRQVSDRAGEARDQAQELVDRVRQRAEEAGRQAADHADAARDQAQQTADRVRRNAEEAGRQATDRADTALNTTGDRLHDAARTIRERAPGGQLGDVAGKAADALERGGDYLRKNDVGSMRGDLETVVREHPLQSIAVGVGVGFLIARGLRSRRG